MKRLVAAFLATVLPISVLMLGPQTVRAASATWLPAPPTGDWNNAANWTPGGPPNGSFDTATFAASNQTSVSLSADVEVDRIVFNAGAASYTITLPGVAFLFTISGAGVSNNSGFLQNFVADGFGIVFMNNATAGTDTQYLVTSDLTGSQHSVVFSDTSTAAGAIFTNNGGAASGASGGFTYFADSATAGNGMFTNHGGAVSGASGAGMFFGGSSTAGNGNITINGGLDSGASGAVTLFTETASAGSATLVANGGFGGGSGGFIVFDLDSSGATSQIKLFGNSTLNISTHNFPGLTIGSLEGNGNVFLGALNLTVGSNGQSTVFSGVIADQGSSGSLTKMGKGTFTLLATNAYSGGTTVIGGTLVASHDGAFGSGNVLLPGPGAILRLGGGVSNDYIADSATLNIVTGSAATLNFTGTPDAIRSLIIDGIPQIDGIYGSATSGAPHQVPQFSGPGTILVTTQPTPSPTPGPPVIISPLTAAATVGQPFVYQFATSGATSLSVTGLPLNLTFNTGLAAITGSPTSAGTFFVSLFASNTVGTTKDTLTLTVQPAPASGPVIVASTSATGRVGQPFTFRVITTGGSPAARLSVIGLPAGLSANAVTGVISGAATTAGSSAVTLTVTDGNLTTTSLLQLTFSADPALPVIVSPGSASLTSGQPFSYTIRAPSSAVEPTIFTLIGNLPAGLGFDPDAGTITGTYSPRPGNGGGLPDAVDLAGGALLGSVQLFGTNSHGTSTFQLLFLAAPSGLVNISTRMLLGTGENVLIGGFIVTGNAPKVVAIRALGPSLAAAGISGALQDPTLELHDGAHPKIVVSNDNWRDSQQQVIQDTGIPPSNDLESAIVAGLDPGNYTAIVRGKANTTGVGVVEVYDLGTASLDASSNARLAQISTRGTVLTGDNVMIGGFIINGAATRVILRAIGPELSEIVPNALQDTILDLRDGSGSLVASNDDWRSTQEQEIIDTGVPPTDNRESAIVATLNPGSYTGIVRGKDDTIGVALVEVYGLQ